MSCQYKLHKMTKWQRSCPTCSDLAQTLSFITARRTIYSWDDVQCAVHGWEILGCNWPAGCWHSLVLSLWERVAEEFQYCCNTSTTAAAQLASLWERGSGESGNHGKESYKWTSQELSRRRDGTKEDEKNEKGKDYWNGKKTKKHKKSWDWEEDEGVGMACVVVVEASLSLSCEIAHPMLGQLLRSKRATLCTACANSTSSNAIQRT